MSAFGKYGTGGSVPGKYPMPSDDNSGGFPTTYGLGSPFEGTALRSPDSFCETPPDSFGSPSHNPGH